MRKRLIAGAAVVAMMVAAPAAAQHRGGGPSSGQWHSGGHWQGGGSWQGHRGGSWRWTGTAPRWGGTVSGRWYGGVGAPGGWGAYQRPARGWRVPAYWTSPSWTVWDWADYGLYAPPRGYAWSRYYDDAVLIDRAGQVYDSRGDVDWGGYDQGYDDGYRDGYDDGRVDADQGPPPPPPADYGYQDYDAPPPPPPAPPPPGEVRFGPSMEVVQPLGAPRLDYPVATTTLDAPAPGTRVTTTTTRTVSKTVPVHRKTVLRKTVRR